MLERLFKRNAEQPGTTVAEPEPDYKAELLAEIRALDVELADHDAAAAAFRVKHTAIVNGQIAFLIPRGGDPGVTRQEIESGWRRLGERRDKIQASRNRVLQNLARFSK